MYIYELINDKTQLFKVFEEKIKQKIRVASPAIISEVDYEKQTLKAQITIREYINGKYIDIPELLDVPFLFWVVVITLLQCQLKKETNA